MRTLSILLILNLTTIYINAQQQDSIKNEIYKLNMWADLPITLGGSLTSYLGLKGISQKPLFSGCNSSCFGWFLQIQGRETFPYRCPNRISDRSRYRNTCPSSA